MSTAMRTVGRGSEGLMALIGLIMLVYGLFLGHKHSVEIYSASVRAGRALERAEGLARPFEARIYVDSSGKSLLYRLLRPLNYEPGKKYPIVVCLHGGGGVGTDNLLQIDGSPSAQFLSNDENRRNYPAFIFVPQCPPGFSWGGVPKHPGLDSIVFETMFALEKEFSIDTSRRYLMGESLGGVGTWYFVSTRPDIFAAAVPVCGLGDPSQAPKMVDVPVWAFHGRNDRSVPVRGSSDMIEAIRKAGGDPLYTEYPEEGHVIAYLVYETPGLLDWMFKQQK